MKAIGGVMPAVPAPLLVQGSVLEAWSAGFGFISAFQTARSALAALLRDRRVQRVWLPAYSCRSVADGAQASGVDVRFYRLDDALALDSEFLETRLRAGDAVLGVDYFGFVDERLADLSGRFGDVLWVEDRAQALNAGLPWGQVLMFSPRKLFGVADGGILVANDPLPNASDKADDALWNPEDARARDPEGLNPDEWYPVFREREANLAISSARVTERTLTALGGTLFAPECASRRANWNTLEKLLPEYAFWRDRTPHVAPLAFPICVDSASQAQLLLAHERVWAPRHWADLPSSASDFPKEHAIADRLLSLPCDPRYGEEDMARMADAVRRLTRPQAA